MNMIVHDKYRNNAVTTAKLMDAGIVLMRENLRRRHPTATATQVNLLLGSWLCRQDDPIPGDTSGPVRVRVLGKTS